MNYAWRDLTRVKYERHEDGAPVPVRHADGTVTLHDRATLLRTKALDENLDAYPECEAFVASDCCDLGANCPFVHLAFVGPRARLYQKASTYRRKTEAKSERAHLHDKLCSVQAAQTTPPSQHNVTVHATHATSTRRVFYRNPYSVTENIVMVYIPITTMELVTPLTTNVHQPAM